MWRAGRGAAEDGVEGRGAAGKASEDERVIDAMKSIRKKQSKDRGTPKFKVPPYSRDIPRALW